VIALAIFSSGVLFGGGVVGGYMQWRLWRRIKQIRWEYRQQLTGDQLLRELL
jgi:hypothetical protein